MAAATINVVSVAGPRNVSEMAEAKESMPAASNRIDLSKTKFSTNTVSPVRWGQGVYQQLTSAAAERGLVFIKSKYHSATEMHLGNDWASYKCNSFINLWCEY